LEMQFNLKRILKIYDLKIIISIPDTCGETWKQIHTERELV